MAEQEKMRAMTLEERQAYRKEKYQDLRRRASEAGLDLPESPPWEGPGGPGRRLMSDEERAAHWEAMRSMTPEERLEYRTQHYQQMRERGKEAGIEMPESPPWAMRAEDEQRIRERIQAMSPEDRQACMQMHRLHMMQMQEEMAQRAPAWESPAPGGMPGYGPESFAPAYPYAPGQGYGRDYGYGRGYGYGTGYGYGSGGPGYYPEYGSGYYPDYKPGWDYGRGQYYGPGYGY